MMKRRTKKLMEEKTDHMSDGQAIDHLAKVCASEYGLDIVEATKRVTNLIKSGTLHCFKPNSNEAAVFTDHFLLIRSDDYARFRAKDFN